MNRRHLLQSLCTAPVIWSGLTSAVVAGPKAEGGATAGGQIRMALVTATVVRRTGRRGVMSVESTLDIADGALLARAQLSLPRLNAAFNETIQRQAHNMLPNTVPDLDAISRALQAAADRVLGRPGAKVLLGTVMVN